MQKMGLVGTTWDKPPAKDWSKTVYEYTNADMKKIDHWERELKKGAKADATSLRERMTELVRKQLPDGWEETIAAKQKFAAHWIG